MAATQYQIFCKYLSESTNKIVSNSSEKEWVSAQTWYQAKVAYNVTNKDAKNAMVLAIDSVNTNVARGSTYRELYDAIRVKMETPDPVTHKRLKYTDLSVEEKKAYDLCQKYLDILDMVANDKCVIEYAMIRPYDELIVVAPFKDTEDSSLDYHHGGHVTADYGKTYKPTLRGALEGSAKVLDGDLAKILYEQLDSARNEKYDMLFTFAGMVQTDEQLDGWICEGVLCTARNYRYYSGDQVLEYLSPNWHQAPNLKPGEEYAIGSLPVRSFNGPYNVPSIRDGYASITVDDVSFSDTDKEICSAVYEGMERLQIQPWFLVATCNSLRAAMTKVEQLISIYGKDAVKLGKVVPIEQYIEIV